MDAKVLIVLNPRCVTIIIAIRFVHIVLLSFSILVAIHVLIPIITLLGISSLVRLPKSGQPKTCTHLQLYCKCRIQAVA